MNGNLSHRKGFTLLEVIVAVGVFSVVLVIAGGALLGVISANRKARDLQTIMNGLSFVVDGMVRQIRTGTDYHCGSGSYSVPQVCSVGDTQEEMAFEAAGGDSGSASDQVVYRLNGTSIERSVDGGGSFSVLTAPEISIDTLKFWVFGETNNDQIQPRVLVLITGVAGQGKEASPFTLQTNITQRIFDEE